MGVFWHVAVFKKQDKINMQDIITQLVEDGNEFEIVPEECSFYDCEAGTVLCLNDFCLAFDGVAKALSQRMKGPVLVCDIYDDDFWDYYLYENGIELDKFMTVPDCLEEIPDEEWEQWRGNAELLAEEFGCEPESLSEFIRFWGEDEGDVWEVVDFLEALGFEFPEEGGNLGEECLDSADMGGTVGEFWEEDTDEPESLYDTGGNYWEESDDAGSGATQIAGGTRWFSYMEPDDEENPVDLVEEVKVDPELIAWVRICKEGVTQQFSGSGITSEWVVQLMDETLNGQYTYFAVDFLLQGEGVYVKRLKKKVYRPFHSTLVLHQGSGKLACLFFAGDSLSCYELIGNFHAYCDVDMQDLQGIRVGNAILAEHAVLYERSGIDRALKMLFSDLESADKRLKESSRWSADIAWPGGINNYNRRRREMGLLED